MIGATEFSGAFRSILKKWTARLPRAPHFCISFYVCASYQVPMVEVSGSVLPPSMTI